MAKVLIPASPMAARHSLRVRLPLLITALLAAVVATFLWAAVSTPLATNGPRRIEVWSAARIPILVVTVKEITAEDRAMLSGYVTTIMAKAEFDGDRFTAEVRRATSGPPIGRLTWQKS